MKHGAKLKSSPDFVRVIDLLRFLPEFQERVVSIRDKLKITPESVSNERLKLLGVEKFQLLLSIEKAGDELSYDLFRQISASPEQQNELYEEVRVWELKRFPKLNIEIGKLRLLELGKVPLHWSESIKDYILYERITNTPLLSRKTARQPIFKVSTDMKTLDPYIEVRIYGDTDISFLTKAEILKMQKVLPTFKEVNSATSRIAYRRLLYYYLRKVKNKSHNETGRILKRHGFKPIDYQYESQEIKRFLKLLKLDQI